MDEILIALKYTPVWVYLLFIYLLIVGIKSLKTTRNHILKLAILPALFTGMWIQTLLSDVGISRMTLSVALLALIVGAMIGWVMVWRTKIEVEPRRFILEIPGNWQNLSTILLIFCVKYYYGYELARDPNSITLTQFEVTMFLVTGVCTGLFIGKFANFLYRIKLARDGFKLD